MFKYCGLAVLLIFTSTTTLAAGKCISEACSPAKLKTLQALAHRGNVEASFALGHMFVSETSGLEINPELSFKYFKKAARYGFLPAMRQSAGMLAKGIGVEKDLTAASQMLRKAVGKNVYRAAEEYAVIVFSNPEASEEEKNFAYQKLQQRVDKQNSYMANYTMAYLHLDDVHFPRDIEKAKALLAFPASGDYANAKQLLAALDQSDSNASSETVVNMLASTSSPSLVQQIERIKVMGIRPDLDTAVQFVMDQLRRTHGQTGSRIKGNGCTNDMPGCFVTEKGKPLNISSSVGFNQG